MGNYNIWGMKTEVAVDTVFILSIWTEKPKQTV